MKINGIGLELFPFSTLIFFIYFFRGGGLEFIAVQVLPMLIMIGLIVTVVLELSSMLSTF